MQSRIPPGTRCGPLVISGDHFVVGEQLGSGVQAIVYACKRESTGEELAVKVIDMRRLDLMGDPEKQRKRIETEINVAIGIKDKNCLGFYDIYRTPDALFLLTEKVPGGELFDKIVKKGAFNEAEAKYVFQQVLDGLDVLHSKGVIHRDLKPENILINSEQPAVEPDSGTLYDVKICDYGLSKIVQGGDAAVTTVGTPQYWAPEVLDSHDTVAYSFPVDFWSLGVLLYVMLRGNYPFKGQDPNTRNNEIRAGKLDFSHAKFQAVSDEAKDLIRKLLEVDPAKRSDMQACRKHPWLCGKKLSDQDETMVAVEQQPSSTAIVSSSSTTFGSGPLSLDQLLQRQVAMVRSLVLAITATQLTQPLLSLKIRALLHEAGTATQLVQRVIAGYGTVAQNVLAKVLPDIALAVEEDVPDMTSDLFEMVDGWVKKMQDDGQNLVGMTEQLSAHLQEVIMDAQKQRLLPQIEGGYSSDSVQNAGGMSIASLSSSRASTTSNAETVPKVLSPLSTVEPTVKEQLCTFADKAVMSENPETVVCDPAAIDLLFMAPKCNLGAIPSSEAIVLFAEKPIDLPEHLSGGDALLRAVRELRDVSRILKDCAWFWANVGETVHELSRMKDHTKVLVTHASKNARLKERFNLRVAEFKQFWQALQAMSEEYCRVVVPRLDYVSAEVSKVEDNLDARTTTSPPAPPLPLTVD